MAAIECEASREGLFLNYRNVKRGLKSGRQKPIMLSLVVSPTLTVSAISTVPTVPAILWHRRRTSGVELRLWGVIQGAVVCPGLRH